MLVCLYRVDLMVYTAFAPYSNVSRAYWRHRRKGFVTRERVREFEGQSKADEHIKAQLQLHIENIQRIFYSATLAYVLHNLKSCLFEELKILVFTRTTSTFWATTMLNLYIRVQVNIFGRHLYGFYGLWSRDFISQDKAEHLDRLGQHKSNLGLGCFY
ncbi:hypothetical protein AMTRI_Chr09g18120 [Amborella trichopoda]